MYFLSETINSEPLIGKFFQLPIRNTLEYRFIWGNARKNFQYGQFLRVCYKIYICHGSISSLKKTANKYQPVLLILRNSERNRFPSFAPLARCQLFRKSLSCFAFSICCWIARRNAASILSINCNVENIWYKWPNISICKLSNITSAERCYSYCIFFHITQGVWLHLSQKRLIDNPFA